MIMLGSELTEDSQYYEMIKKVESKHMKDTKLNHKRVCLLFDNNYIKLIKMRFFACC